MTFCAAAQDNSPRIAQASLTPGLNQRRVITRKRAQNRLSIWGGYSMKFTLRSASSAALLVGLAGSLPAFAQQTTAPAPAPQAPETVQAAAPPEREQAADRVVVTGSYIAGTPEDAALPVEVFSSEE